MSAVLKANNDKNKATTLPAEMIAEIAAFLRSASPAGTALMDHKGSLKYRSLGWTVITHVCRWWRASTLDLRTLWRQDVCAFPSQHAVSEIAWRAGQLGLIMDLDRLLKAAGENQKSAFFGWLMVNGRDLFARAEIIRCTFVLGQPLASKLNYSSKEIDLSAWIAALDNLTYPRLTTLLLPITDPYILYLPRINATSLTTLTLLGLSLAYAHTPVRRGRQRTGYTSHRAWDNEPEGDMSSLVDALQTMPALQHLRLEGVHFCVEADDVVNPVQCDSLRFIHVYCADSACIPFLRSNIIAPDAMWQVVTRNSMEFGALDALWDTSGLTSAADLKLYVEANQSKKWITFCRMNDACSALPVFCDGNDELRLRGHQTNPPDAYARLGKLTFAYAGEINTQIRAIMTGRVREVVVRPMVTSKNGMDVWEDSHEDWSFMSCFEKYSLDIQDERLLHEDLASLAKCPTILRYTCQENWHGSSGFHGLDVALASWSVGLGGKRPKSVIVEGVRRWWDDAATRNLQGQPGVRVSDRRLYSRDLTTRPGDPLRAELALAKRELVHAEMLIAAMKMANNG